MSYISDFKKFISRGNAIDMAVGIIIGASFTKIVDALVNKVLMPPIGFVLGGIDFSNFSLTLKKATETSAAVSIEYGFFINTIINFFIVAASIFILISLVGAIYRKRAPKAAPPKTKSCPECLMEIPIEAKRCGHCTSLFSS